MDVYVFVQDGRHRLRSSGAISDNASQNPCELLRSFSRDSPCCAEFHAIVMLGAGVAVHVMIGCLGFETSIRDGSRCVSTSFKEDESSGPHDKNRIRHILVLFKAQLT